MGTFGKIWRWGVVVPVTVAAFAGAVADIVTGTVLYWWLLAPSYFVIAIATWRGSAKWVLKAFTARQLAQPPPPPPAVALDQPALVEAMATGTPVTIGGVLRGLWWGAMRLLATLVITFVWMICIWAAIAIGAWARPYWYVYVPGAVMLAILGWLIWRMGAPTKAEQAAERAGRQARAEDNLVR